LLWYQSKVYEEESEEIHQFQYRISLNGEEMVKKKKPSLFKNIILFLNRKNETRKGNYRKSEIDVQFFSFLKKNYFF
jgi:hypothetical protein